MNISNIISIPQPQQTEAAATATETVAPAGVNPVLEKLAMTRFNATFKLEGEVVGVVRYKTSKKGAVTMSLKPANSSTGESLATLSKLKGDALEAYRQGLAQKMKEPMLQVAAKLTADKGYEGGKAKMLPNGRVVLEWKPVKDEVIVAITDEQAMKVLGIDPLKWNEGKALVTAEEAAPVAPAAQ